MRQGQGQELSVLERKIGALLDGGQNPAENIPTIMTFTRQNGRRWSRRPSKGVAGIAAAATEYGVNGVGRAKMAERKREDSPIRDEFHFDGIPF